MDDNLYCNITKCRSVLSDVAIVTRCFHVFCRDHGKSYFFNNAPQVNCPICNEANVKEVDIIQCEINPNDVSILGGHKYSLAQLILGGLSPEKAINAVISCVKLWKKQHKAEQELGIAQVEHLNQKLHETKQEYKKIIRDIQINHNSEITALKSCYEEVIKKMNGIAQELEMAKKSKKKYQVAYNSLLHNSTNNFFGRQSPNFALFGNDLSPITQSVVSSMVTSDNFLTRHFNV